MAKLYFTMKLTLEEFLQHLSKHQRTVFQGSKPEHKKLELHSITHFFIGAVWSEMRKELFSNSVFGLRTEASKFTDLWDETLFRENLVVLFERNKTFPPAWVRSQCEKTISVILKEKLSQLSFKNELARYKKLLRETKGYWFRETPYQHLKLGFHTGISVASKLFGNLLLVSENSLGKQHIKKKVEKVAYLLASHHLEMLLALDTVLWDGAQATGIPTLSFEKGEFYIDESELEKAKKKFPRFQHNLQEPRLGCPAMKQTLLLEASVMEELLMWMFDIYETYIFPIYSPRVSIKSYESKFS